MRNSLFVFYYLMAVFVCAKEVTVDLVKIKLNPTDALGIFKVIGGITLNVDTHSLEVESFNSTFSAKAIGIGLNNTFSNTQDIYYNRPMDLVHGSEIALGGFNQEKTLASLIIQDQQQIFNSPLRNYTLKLNYLLAFGKTLTSTCQKSENIIFQLVQNGINFKLRHAEMKSSIVEIKLYLEALGKEKKISKLELIAKDKSIKTIKYKNCTKV